jgi:hypothetical protein
MHVAHCEWCEGDEEVKVSALILEQQCDLAGTIFAIDLVEKIAIKVFKSLIFAILQFLKFRILRIWIFAFCRDRPAGPSGSRLTPRL